MGSYASYRIKSPPESVLTHSCGHTSMKNSWPESLDHDRKCAIERPCKACGLADQHLNAAAILRRLETLELPPLIKPDDMDQSLFERAELGRGRAIDAIRKMCGDPADFFFLSDSAALFEKMLAKGGTDAKAWLRAWRNCSDEGHRYLMWWRSDWTNPLG